MKLFSLTLLSLTLSALFSLEVFAMPVGSFDALKVANKNLTGLDPNYDFNGIIKLSNCSGSIIHFTGMPVTAKAIAMTNGHCLGSGMPDPGEVVVNQAVSRSMRVYNKSQKSVSIAATKVLYSTMTNTDITLYELKDTYKDLMAKGVDAFELEATHPGLGTSIDVVSGYWDRGYRCDIDAFIYELKEAGWTMKDSIRYSATGCNTIGGTSGSPIIQTGTRTVIGINNTGNEDGDRCTMDNPCEVDAQGNVVVRPHASYGQQTYRIYSCLTPAFTIDLNMPNCELYKPSSNFVASKKKVSSLPVTVSVDNNKTIHAIISNSSAANLTCKFTVSYFVDVLNFKKYFGKVTVAANSNAEVAISNDPFAHLSQVNARVNCQ